MERGVTFTEPEETEARETKRSRGLARKTGIGIAGGAVMAAGLVMLVTPGPGIVVTLAGLGILSREFPSAHRLRSRLGRLVRTSDGDDHAG